MKKNVLLYPYTKECDSLIEYLQSSENIGEVFLVSFKGWGYEQKELLFRNNKLYVKTDFWTLAELCDEIWVMDTNMEIDEEQLINSKIEWAISKEIQVKWFRKNTYSYNKKEDAGGIKEDIDLPTKLQVINTPIVIVSGLFGDGKEFDVELSLNQEMKKSGYKFIQIGSKKAGEIVGMYNYPDFFYSNLYSNREKILLFNQYIKKIEEKELPDLIILGIPNGISLYSREIVNDFGMNFNLVKNAVSEDLFILSMPYSDIDNNYLEILRKNIWERYKSFIDYFVIESNIVNDLKSKKIGRTVYLSIDKNLVLDKVKELDNKDVFSLEKPGEKERLNSDIIKKFKSFGEITLI